MAVAVSGDDGSVPFRHAELNHLLTSLPFQCYARLDCNHPANSTLCQLPFMRFSLRCTGDPSSREVRDPALSPEMWILMVSECPSSESLRG